MDEIKALLPPADATFAIQCTVVRISEYFQHLRSRRGISVTRKGFRGDGGHDVDFQSLKLCDRWMTETESRFLLECVRELQQPEIVPVAANNLDSDREPGRSETRGDRNRRSKCG